MRDWKEIRCRGYVRETTPLVELPRFSDLVGGRVRMKRDDLLPLGGNKIRKLDYLMADALASGADTMITASTNQCSHNSMIAMLAAREGLKCRLIMESWGDPRYQYPNASNYQMLQLCGPEEVMVVSRPPSGPVDAMPEARRMGQEIQSCGRKPYYLPRGGSGPLGAVGYIRCAEELIRQWGDDRPDAVVCPCGIGGTQAGLLVGLHSLGCVVPVIGIGVTGKNRADMEASVRVQCRELTDFLETRAIPDDAVVCEDRYAGRGYGKPGKEQLSWMRELASSEGILTDPVYSGKALYGMCGILKRGAVFGAGGVVFLHTGGLQLFYDYASLSEMEAET